MRKIKIGILLAAALMLLIGCSKSMDIHKTSETILATLTFDDEMILASESVVDNLYLLPETGVEDYVVYVSGSGATANEFAIFKVKDNDAATAVKTALATRVETLTTNFENYVPDELNRINNKLILQKGDYVLFAITNANADVQDIFSNALK
jgi:hypothetical protein